MTRLSVIVPSRTDENVQACVYAVKKMEPLANIVVVDDGLQYGVMPNQEPDYKPIPRTVRTIKGKKPFCFAANINLGIQAAGDDDVIVLNDDALLQTPGGFTTMQRAADEHGEFGLIAATCNNVGNVNQWPKGIGLREEPRMVCFVCVLIPREVIDTVGLLDTRFTGYGLDDDDFCLRVRKAGLKIGIHDGCYVDHGSLRSTYRGDPTAPADYRPNLELFKQKWGVDNFGNPA